MKEITVLMVEPNKHPVVKTIGNDLDSLQKAVSIGAEEQGLIEIIGIDDGVCIVCNEEGKLIGLEGNRRLGSDIIAGVFYVVGEDGRGNLTSLPQELLEAYRLRFWEPVVISESDVIQSMVMRLFVSLIAPHERLMIGGVERRLRELGRKLSIPRVHPHKFRRTLATTAIDKGMPIEQVQQLLGHQKIDTTLHYAMVKQQNVKLAHRKYIG